MIAHIAGILESTEQNNIIVDVNGVGYEITATANVLTSLPREGEFVKVYTYHQVREDGVALYGFASRAEKDIFESLISVSGIGAKIAMGIIASIEKERLVNAIMTNDLVTLTALPGIGKKTAERLILELKDKIGKLSPISLTVTATAQNTRDAISALTQLGYNSREVAKVMAQIEAEITPELSVEAIIKKALKSL